MTTNPAGYWDRDSMMAEWDRLVAENPSKIFKSTPKQSRPIHFYADKRTMGIPLYKVGNLNAPSAILIDGECHGSEWGSAEMLWKFAEWLIQGTESLAVDLASKYQFWLLPMLNIGYYSAMWDNVSPYTPRVWNGSAWIDMPANGRYNGYTPSGVWVGADLNRTGGSGTPADNHTGAPWVNGYPGEPETQLLYDCWSNPLVKAYVNLHCGNDDWLRTSLDAVNNYSSVASQAVTIATQMGVAPYSLGSTSAGYLLAQGSQKAVRSDGSKLMSYQMEWCPMWRDKKSDGTYPRPPDKATVFLTQSSGSVEGGLKSHYYYKRPFAVFAAVAYALPVAGATANLNLSSTPPVNWVINDVPECPPGTYKIPLGNTIKLGVPNVV